MGSSCSLVGIEDPSDLLALASHRQSPLWSKDGSYIYFAHQPSGLFVVDASGSHMWSLPPGSHLGTSLRPGSFSPSLSPDGSRLAYITVGLDDWGNYYSEVVTSAIDGSRLRRLTKGSGINAQPTWSPNGTQIAFISDRVKGSPMLHVHIMDSDGSNVRSLAPSVRSLGHPPVWSPDGSRIAFVGYQSYLGEITNEYVRRYIIYTVRTDGSGLAELGDTVSNPAWSSDGSRVAFIRIEDETHEKSSGLTHSLYSVGADGADPQQLRTVGRDAVRGQTWYDNLRWPPDGSEILYGFHGYRPLKGTVGGPARSPDDTRVAFHVDSDDSNVVLYTMARDGSDVRVLVRGDHERLVAENSDLREVSDDFAACSGGFVVPEPKKNHELVQDCETLLRIRDPLAGNAVLNWSAEVRISEWEGVLVQGTPPRVVQLGWGRSAKLNGRIPPELSGLSSLQSLFLDSNHLSGAIPPELGNLANLREMALRGNRLSGSIPPELGNLSNLERLDIGGNDLSGSIPAELGNLSSLQKLILGPNSLSGSIPPELGNLSNLENLNLEHNDLSGSIPPELGNLTKLTGLSLKGNPLTGNIPQELGNLWGLRGLNITGTDLTGCIPIALRRLEKPSSTSLFTDGLDYC